MRFPPGLRNTKTWPPAKSPSAGSKVLTFQSEAGGLNAAACGLRAIPLETRSILPIGIAAQEREQPCRTKRT